MVRLKEQNVGRTTTIEAGFQFHYGSIKSQRLRSNIYKTESFQFHYGSIKSGDRTQETELRIFFFTFSLQLNHLVRLKV